MSAIKRIQEDHKKFQADLLACFENQEELIKLVKQCIGNCEDLAKANREDMAASIRSLKTVLEEDALIQEKVTVQDEKI